MVRIKVERQEVQVPWKNGLYTHDHDVIYISEKRGRKYEPIKVIEGDFSELTTLLAQKGRKLGGGKDGWTEFYEIDEHDLDEFLLSLV
ncbi:MAG: hypothetical protein J7K48_03890 [Thermococcus sp.]|nr:hypothetical protein [Thermococcus sp.]